MLIVNDWIGDGEAACGVAGSAGRDLVRLGSRMRHAAEVCQERPRRGDRTALQ